MNHWHINIIPIETLSISTLDLLEDRRITPTSFVDIRFRVAAEEITRVGYVIETVQIEARYKGTARPQIRNIVSAAMACSATPSSTLRVALEAKLATDFG